jgi:hypothetical protein
MDLVFGRDRSVLQFLGLRIGESDFARVQNSPRRLFDRVRQPAWQFSPNAYEFYAYTKPKLLLDTLEHRLGARVMAHAMRTYHERWRFRHPSSDDFYAVVRDVSGTGHAEFLKQTVEGTGIVDYEVSSIQSTEPPEPSGIHNDKAATPIPHAKGAQPRRPARWTNRVVVRRLGEVVVPVGLVLRYADGSSERVAWDGAARWTRIEREGPKELVAAEIGPDQAIALDVDRINDTKRLAADGRLATAWTARWIFWIQNLLAGGGL